MAVDISVVVPVYNTERYLPECIESLIHQTLKNVEFIFVDDGSTDRSVDIIEKYQKQDNRIQLLKQKNLYAGVARNNGMKRATGKYIIFLDSDDFFELNMLEEAFQCSEKNQAEITVFGYYDYDDTKHIVHKKRNGFFPTGVCSAEKVGETIFDLYNAAPWNKLFLLSFIKENGLEYQAIRKCNDTYFTHIAAFSAHRIVFLKKRFVYYRINNSGSLQGNVNKDRSSIILSEKAVRDKLIETGLFYGINKKAYYRYLKKILYLYTYTRNAELMSYKQYYDTLKRELIPGLFDSIDDFIDEEWIVKLYDGTFESFLLYRASQLEEELMNSVSKESIDYQIGHKMLSLPRAAYHFWQDR